MEFHDGLNVIIGSNNSGKTGLLYTIALLNNPESVSINDFNKNNLMRFTTDYKESAPQIEIEYTIHHEISEDNTEDESIIKLISFLGIDKIQEAKKTEQGQKGIYSLVACVKITYILDTKYLGEYQKSVASINSFDEYCKALNLFQSHYSWVFTNGMTDTSVDKKEATSIFRIDFIEAERNSQAVYKETRREIEAYVRDNNAALQQLQQDLSASMKTTMEPLLSRISGVIETGRDEIGLSKGNVSISQDMRPSTSVSNSYIIDVKDTKSDYILPLTHNGLGYNNLINIYMLIKLTEIQKGKDFRILCLEEPEAHLHPAMQYKLFKYLKNLDETNNLNQQIFVTTHSSNISSVAGIDNMFMLAYERNGIAECKQQSLKKQFENKANSKAHMSKFLDVTRSDMLFADRIIIVEGIAEKLLLPAFMEKCNCPYEDEHIAIVEIGGKHFEHFVNVFAGNAVQKKVLCITDNDFSWINNGSISSIDDYKNHEASHIKKLKSDFPFPNLHISTQHSNGRTFEDELFISNISNNDISKKLMKIALSESMEQFIDLNGVDFDSWDANRTSIDGRSKNKIENLLDVFKNAIAIGKTESEKTVYRQLFFAELFLLYAKDRKGDVALDILVDEELLSGIAVPGYIKEGLEWLLK